MKIRRFHHIYDLENCNDKINSREDLKLLIEKVVEAIEMKIIERLIFAEGNPSEPGVTALAIIDFSHVSVHAFIKHNEALIDVFSIKEFDRKRVLEIIKEFIGTPESTIQEKDVWWG